MTYVCDASAFILVMCVNQDQVGIDILTRLRLNFHTAGATGP